MQLLRAVEGTGLHLCRYRRTEFAMYVTVHSYPNDIHVLSLILTVCLVCNIYNHCIEHKLRPVLCCINFNLSDFECVQGSLDLPSYLHNT